MSFYIDVVRNSLLDSNYGLNAASCSKEKQTCDRKGDGAAAMGAATWSKNSEWTFQQPETDSNSVYGPSQYHQNVPRNYWN